MKRSCAWTLAILFNLGIPNRLAAQDQAPMPTTGSPSPQTQPRAGSAPGMRAPATSPGVPQASGGQAPTQVNGVSAPRTAPVEIPVENLPPAPSIPVSDSLKSSDQRSFEADVQTRIEALAKEIETLEARPPLAQASRQRIFQEMLQTAAGNRSVARTKLKQIKLIPPAQWLTLKPGMEKALLNLEDSVSGAKSFVSVP